MRIIHVSEHRRMPWKNGGGVTSEILVEPADGARFLYRLSIADVASDGPFSRFEGYDRHIMVLDGAGMRLDCGAHGTIALTRLVPRMFSGDWDVHGALAAGAVRDFNLIVDRARATSDLAVRDVTGTTHFEPCIVYVLEGSLDVAAPGDTIVAQAPFDVVGTAKLAVAHIALR